MGLSVVTFESMDMAFLASFDGILGEENGCLILVSEASDARALLAFKESEVSVIGGVTSAYGKELVPGATLSFGGGFVDPARLRGLKIPDGCPDASMIVVSSVDRDSEQQRRRREARASRSPTNG